EHIRKLKQTSTMSPISLHISLFSFVTFVPSSSWYATTCVTRKFLACVGCREEFGGQKVKRLALAEMSYTPSCMFARRRQNRKTDGTMELWFIIREVKNKASIIPCSSSLATLRGLSRHARQKMVINPGVGAAMVPDG